MAVTVEQAEKLVEKLEAAFDKKLPPERFRIYVEKLKKVPCERGHRGVEQCIEKERNFPTVAVILEHCLSVTLEGTPNALAYYTGPQRDYAAERERNRRAIEHMERIMAMSDEEYERYLIEYGRRLERKRQERSKSAVRGDAAWNSNPATEF